MTNIMLEVSDLTKQYSNNRGAKDISFALNKGEALGLLGSNGAGKTTVMKTITGLTRANKGKISINGFDINENRAQALERVGSLIEAPAFYGYLSAEKNMQLALNFYKELKADSENIISDILKKVGLLQFRNEKVDKFSLGMKQRMGIALAMVGKPELFILDEPSNGLDIEGRVEIRNILINLCAETNATLLISSHLSVEIEKMCSKVVIMKEGIVIDIADMKQILENNPDLETYYLEKIQGGIIK